MTDNTLHITEDVKSAFADLLGRKPKVSNIKIEGKHISLPNHINANKQNPLQTNDNHSKINDIERIHSPKHQEYQDKSLSSSSNLDENESPNTSYPSRGSVLASYIDRFRNSPAINPYRRDTIHTNNSCNTDFWWIKNGKKQLKKNRIPNTKIYKQKQTTIVNNTHNSDSHNIHVHSINSSISDEINHSKFKQPQIECKNENNNNSNNNNNNNNNNNISSKEIIKELTESNFESSEYINNSTIYDNDLPIDVDDILEKWRKKRRLKQLSKDNGINCNDPISDLFNNNNNELELYRIKERLGLICSEQNALTPTQPFTATIHPIINTQLRIPFNYHQTQTSETTQVTQPIIDDTKTCTHITEACAIIEDENKQENMKESCNFLSDQQLLREQQAKTERLALIQRRMCLNEKKVLTQTKCAQQNSFVNVGRQKKICSHSFSTNKLKLEENDESNDDNEENISKCLSKSVQTNETMPNISTTKISKIEPEKSKNKIKKVEETKSINLSLNAMHLLPQNIINELNKLYKNGQLKNVNDFDIHFRKILNSQRNNKRIAKKLLTFININEIDDNKCELIFVENDVENEEEKQYEINDKIEIINESTPELLKVSHIDHHKAEILEIKKNEDENDENKETENNYKQNEEENNDNESYGISNCIQSNKCKTNKQVDNEFNDEIINIDEDEENKSDEDHEVDIAESDIILDWINQHPDYYFEPSTQTDIQVIKNFVDGSIANISNNYCNENENENDFVDNDYQQIIHEKHEIISLNNDLEVLTLIKSCKTLRDNISVL